MRSRRRSLLEREAQLDRVAVGPTRTDAVTVAAIGVLAFVGAVLFIAITLTAPDPDRRPAAPTASTSTSAVGGVGDAQGREGSSAGQSDVRWMFVSPPKQEENVDIVHNDETPAEAGVSCQVELAGLEPATSCMPCRPRTRPARPEQGIRGAIRPLWGRSMFAGCSSAVRRPAARQPLTGAADVG